MRPAFDDQRVLAMLGARAAAERRQVRGSGVAVSATSTSAVLFQIALANTAIPGPLKYLAILIATAAVCAACTALLAGARRSLGSRMR